MPKCLHLIRKPVGGYVRFYRRKSQNVDQMGVFLNKTNNPNPTPKHAGLKMCYIVRVSAFRSTHIGFCFFVFFYFIGKICYFPSD